MIDWILVPVFRLQTNKRVGHGFVANRCFWAVSWVAGGFGIEGVEVLFDRGFELFEA